MSVLPFLVPRVVLDIPHFSPVAKLFQYSSFHNVILAPSSLRVLRAFDAGNDPNPLFHSVTPFRSAP